MNDDNQMVCLYNAICKSINKGFENCSGGQNMKTPKHVYIYISIYIYIYIYIYIIFGIKNWP